MSRDKEDCLPFLKALSDEARWAIVRVLIESPEPLALGELSRRTGFSAPKASRHVSTLAEVGIVRAEKEGRRRLISIAPNHRERIVSEAENREVLDLGCCSFEFPERKNG